MIVIVPEQLTIIKLNFCVESELRNSLSRQDFEIYEVMHTRNGDFDGI